MTCRTARARRMAPGAADDSERGAGLVSEAVAVVLFFGVSAYALFGGADFGSGFWDLTAGGTERGARPRRGREPTRSVRSGKPTTSG